MPYTFGAGTGDDINIDTTSGPGANDSDSLIYGWWMPTTLTATRGLWSNGNVTGAEIDATTDELRLRSDTLTTDGQYTTTGVDLAIDQWKFIAFFLTCVNGGPAVTWKVWAGDIHNSPTAVTVTTATSPTGNLAASTAFTIGNKGTGTVAFQGDIAHVGCVTALSVGTTPTTNPFNIASRGTVTADEEQFILERFVQPAWVGDLHKMWDVPPGMSAMNQGAWHCNLDVEARWVYFYLNTTGNERTQVINGATWSQNGAPRPHVGMAMHPRPRR